MMPNTEKYILQLTGMAGSGKTSVADRLSQEYGFTVVTVSSLLGTFAREVGLPSKTRAELRAVHALWVQGNPNAITDAICQLPDSRICVDGMRVPKHALEIGRTVVSDVIWLESPNFDVRYKRCQERRNQQQLRLQSIEEFRTDELPDMFSFDLAEANLWRMFMMAQYKLPAGTEDQMYDHLIDFLNDNGRIPA